MHIEQLSIEDLDYLIHSIVVPLGITFQNALSDIPVREWHLSPMFEESMKVDDLTIKLLGALISAKAVSN